MAGSKETLTYCVGFIIGMAIASCHFALEAYVITKMWLWHVVPLGMPAITLLHAAALDLLIFFSIKSTFKSHQLAPEYRQTESEFQLGVRAMFYLYGRPLVVLGIGYLLFILR